MPGFNVSGLGGASGMPSNVTEIRRKHRWTFLVIGRGTGTFSQTELLFLQSASRPTFKFDPAEMHHNQEIVRFAGKQDWEPVTLTWYDAEQNPDICKGTYQWIETVVDMTMLNVAHPAQYKKQAVLQIENGFGEASEQWTMYGTWPESINWQTLDYSSSELLTVEASMRYDRAIRSCVNSTTQNSTSPSC